MNMERENYFFELTETEKKDKILVLIIYDIVDNKRRNKLAKHLQGYGERIQKSAFEAKLTKKKYDKLVKEVPRYCTEEDSIRIYKIIGKSQVMAWGISKEHDEEDIILI